MASRHGGEGVGGRRVQGCLPVGMYNAVEGRYMSRNMMLPNGLTKLIQRRAECTSWNVGNAR